MSVDMFSLFNQVTKRTAKNPVPVVNPDRAREIRNENIARLRSSSQESIQIQNHYDTPRNHAFPNSRTGEEKEQIAEGKAAANPYSQARHPSPRYF